MNGTPSRRQVRARRFICGIVALLSVACGGAPSPPDTDVTIWEPRGRWSGDALLQTDPFISTTGLLRVSWQARTIQSGDDATFTIVLHSDVSGRSLVPVVDQRGPGAGVKYVSEDPRSFFLVIDGRGVDWSVDVAEGLPATRVK
jgi:hypothetical protein